MQRRGLARFRGVDVVTVPVVPLTPATIASLYGAASLDLGFPPKAVAGGSDETTLVGGSTVDDPSLSTVILDNVLPLIVADRLPGLVDASSCFTVAVDVLDADSTSLGTVPFDSGLALMLTKAPRQVVGVFPGAAAVKFEVCNVDWTSPPMAAFDNAMTSVAVAALLESVGFFSDNIVVLDVTAGFDGVIAWLTADARFRCSDVCNMPSCWPPGAVSPVLADGIPEDSFEGTFVTKACTVDGRPRVTIGLNSVVVLVVRLGGVVTMAVSCTRRPAVPVPHGSTECPGKLIATVTFGCVVVLILRIEDTVL